MSSNTATEIIAVQERRPSALALVPTDFAQAFNLAEVMARASIIPSHLKGKPDDCFLVLMRASEWGMNPLAVAEKTSVIGGKLNYEGQLVAALVNTRCGLEEPLDYEFTGEGKTRSVRVIGKAKGWTKERDILLTHEQACKINKNGQMGINPDQQMCYIGARIWARRHSPQTLLGVYAADEISDEIPELPTGASASEAGAASGDSNQQQPAAKRVSVPRKAKGANAQQEAATPAESTSTGGNGVVVEAEVTEVVTSPATKAEPAPEPKQEAKPEPKPEPKKEEVKKTAPAPESEDIEAPAPVVKPAGGYKPKYPQTLPGWPLVIEATIEKVEDRQMVIEPRAGGDKDKRPAKLVHLGGKAAAEAQVPRVIFDPENQSLNEKAKPGEALMKITLEVWPSQSNPNGSVVVATQGEDIDMM